MADEGRNIKNGQDEWSHCKRISDVIKGSNLLPEDDTGSQKVLNYSNFLFEARSCMNCKVASNPAGQSPQGLYYQSPCRSMRQEAWIDVNHFELLHIGDRFFSE